MRLKEWSSRRTKVTQTMRKAEIWSKLVKFLIDKEIVSEDEPLSTTNAIELWKLELQDKDKEQETQLKMKELEIWEHELAMQLKTKELELIAAFIHPPVSAGQPAEFDVSEQVRFVPPFQEKEVNKYFFHFKKVATSLFMAEMCMDTPSSGFSFGKSSGCLLSFISRAEFWLWHSQVSYS